MSSVTSSVCIAAVRKFLTCPRYFGCLTLQALGEGAKMKEAKIRRWRAIPGCEEYLVSNDGRVRRAGAANGVFIRPRFSRGRPRYHLPYIGGRLSVDAHILVARAFLPEQPPGKTWVLHADDDPLHCIDTNLRWGDRWDNAKDYVANRRRRLGMPPRKDVPEIKLKPTYRLKPAKVFEIMKAPGTHVSIAKKYDVSRPTVTKIKNGKRWAHLFTKQGDGQATKL